MPLPTSKLLSLEEAVDHVVERCAVTREAAQARLERAFRDRELRLVNCKGRGLHVGANVQIDWDPGSLTWLPQRPGAAGVIRVGIRTSAVDLRKWLATTTNPTNPSAVPRTRGRRSEKRDKVTRAMIDAINSGRLSLPELRGAKMEYLAKTYGVSRDTIRKALAAVEAEFAKKTISDK